MTILSLSLTPAAVEAERDPETGVTYLEAGGIQLSINPDGLMLATLPVSAETLRALMAILDRPEVRALANAEARPASLAA